MAKLLFKLNSASDEEASDIKNLLSKHQVDFYESPGGNWGVSMHALWLKEEHEYPRAKKLIDDYQTQRSLRIREETRQKIDSGELETFVQRLFSKPVQVLFIVAAIVFILYFSIIPFLEIGSG